MQSDLEVAKKMRILVIHDELATRDIFTLFLEKYAEVHNLDVEIQFAENGESARELIADEEVELVLFDLELEEMPASEMVPIFQLVPKISILQ